MSRSGYTDDCDELELYRGRVANTIKGKRSQSFLKELAEEMDRMPEKILIAEELIDGEGDCCTIGVVVKSRGLDPKSCDYDEPEEVGGLVGISSIMAAEIEFVNDEMGKRDETPSDRWIRVRKWVARKIAS